MKINLILLLVVTLGTALSNGKWDGSVTYIFIFKFNLSKAYMRIPIVQLILNYYQLKHWLISWTRLPWGMGLTRHFLQLVPKVARNIKPWALARQVGQVAIQRTLEKQLNIFAQKPATFVSLQSIFVASILSTKLYVACPNCWTFII